MNRALLMRGHDFSYGLTRGRGGLAGRGFVQKTILRVTASPTLRVSQNESFMIQQLLILS